jgi:hypothetical protein
LLEYGVKGSFLDDTLYVALSVYEQERTDFSAQQIVTNQVTNTQGLEFDEPMQSSRIFPVFAAIGRRLDLAQSITGVEARLAELVGSRRNQADSTLYVLVVAICYRRNGWDVEFVPEAPPEKRPDFVVTRGDEKYYVECERLAKATEYSELERQAWLARWRHLSDYMQKNSPPAFVDVLFKVPVEKTDEYCVAALFSAISRENPGESNHIIETDELIIQSNSIDMDRVQSHFDKFHVRHPSPQFIALLADGYESSGSYTIAFVPSDVGAFGPDDDEHTLNIFIGGLKTAYCAKWECIADESIDKKAKDVRTHLSRAVSQIPTGEPGLIHIGFETLHGPEVEFHRHEKILNTIRDFDYGDKQIDVVFCNALQPESGVETWDFAETTAFFSNRRDALEILPETLLMDDPTTVVHESTHWQQDIERKLAEDD